MFSGLRGDVTCGVRTLRRHAASTGLALLVMAIGIGGTSSVFSVLYATLLRPLALHDPDRLVSLRTGTPSEPDDYWSGPDFLDLAAKATQLNGVAAHRALRYAISGGPEPDEIRGVSVTANFFDLLGVAPQLGRLPRTADSEDSGGRPAVLSAGLWQSRFAGSRDIVGRSITLNDKAFTVVAVMPASFDYPHGARLWTVSPFRVPEPPFDFGDNPEVLRGAHYFPAFARLAPGTTVVSAGRQVEAVSAELAARFKATNADRRAHLIPLLDAEVGDVRSTLWLLAGAVACLLGLGCANVANLLLARAAGREREVQIRAAVGASGYRVVRQFLVEGLILGLLGGGLGVLASAWGLDALVTIVPRDVPRLDDIRLDLPVLAFALLTTLVASLLAGIAPAVHAFGARRVASGIGVGTRASRGRQRRVLVIVEVALSLVLVLGAGLMVRTLVHLRSVDLGFRTDAVIAGRVSLPSPRYSEDGQIRTFARSALERLAAMPGIVSAGAVMSLPVDGSGAADLRVQVAGRPVQGQAPVAGFQTAAPGYFETLRIPLLRGRLFTSADRDGSPPVAIVSEAFAQQFFPDVDPIGQRLAWSDPADPATVWSTVVGVVGNTRRDGAGTAPKAEVYKPLDQAAVPYFWLVARGALGTDSTTRAIRAAVSSVDPARPVSPVRTLDEVVARSLLQPRFGALVIGLFAVLALVMAALGLYAVLACEVVGRTREIGIRMALGARRLSVVAAVFADGSRMVAMGLAVGLIGAAATSRFIASQLHGVGVADPLTVAACLGTLCVASALATLVPAWRASRVDPAESLRADG
jgi:putative ABC transport system permease protein